MVLDPHRWLELRRFRPLYESGAMSLREIAKETGLNRRTVSKYLKNPASAAPPKREVAGQRPRRVVDEVAPLIDAILRAEVLLEASVIHERLVQNYAVSINYQRVKLYLQETQPRIAEELGISPGELAGLHRRFEVVPGAQAQGDWVADGEFLVPGGDRAVTLEAIDPAFDRVPLPIVDLVELRRPATVGAALLAVADLVGLVRDRAADPASPQVGAVLARGIRLVRPHAIGPGAGSARPDAGHADGLQDGLELRGVPALPGRDHDRHGLLALLDSQVQLGGQAAARASEPVVAGLDGDAAGRLLLQVPLSLDPAACWWARQTVKSTLMSQVIRFFASAWASSSVKTRFQVPSRCQRRNRSYTRPQGPYRSGTSRHGVPVRVRHRMPAISYRRVHIGGRPGFVPSGSSGSSRAHCASVRSPRATKQDHFTSKIHFRHTP